MNTLTARPPLLGIRVLDLSGTIAGAVAGMLLGDHGAEVVHVEPRTRAGQDPLPGAAMWHRNKVCSTVDWHSATDVGGLVDRLRGADLVITTDADTEAALGLDAEPVPHLVHLSMPTAVPLASGGVEVDDLTWAALGLAARQPSFEGGPIDAAVPLVGYTHGAWAATAAVAALYERVGSGTGQRVVVDGVHGALVAGTTVAVIDPTLPPLMTATGPNRSPIIAPYRCADDAWIFFVALGRTMRTAFETLGVGWVLDDERIQGMAVNLLAEENQGWVSRAIADAAATQPLHHWVKALEDAGCPVGIIGSRDEWLDHPQVVALGQRKVVHDPLDGEVVMGGALVNLSGAATPDPQGRRVVEAADLPTWQPQPAPSNLPAQQSDGPLDGVHVVNIGLFLAGPYGGMLLSELGAKVSKVEKLTGNNSRDGAFHMIRGQRSLAIDLHDQRGHSMFLELVKQADVVMDNFRPGVLGRLRLTHYDLAAVRPDIITASVTSFGDVGPMAGEGGMDPLIQAISGMMGAQGGDSDPVQYATGPADLIGGVASAFGVCLALFDRARGGRGQRVDTSLVAGSVFLQAGELLRSEGRPPARVGGRDHRGPAAHDRFYPTTDGWVRVHAPDAGPFVAAGLLPETVANDAEAAQEIGAHLAAMTREDALTRLAAAGIAAVPARNLNDLPGESFIRDGGYLATQESIDDTTLYLPRRFASFSRTERQETLRTPGTGEHSRELLTEFGFTPETIDAAIADGVVKQGGPVIWFSVTAGQW